MLYETLLQGKIFLVLLYFGILCGIVLTSKKMLTKMTKNNKVLLVLTDTLFLSICAIAFIFARIKFCYGEFRIFHLVAFLLGILLEQISLNKLVEKFFTLLYNISRKIFNKLKNIKIIKKILR